MICFRDMTFCPFWQDCDKAANCHRPLTDHVVERAKVWWGSDDAPIARFSEKPDCHVQKQEETP